MMMAEKDSIKVIDRRRFYLDDDGDVHERDPEEKIVHVGSSGMAEVSYVDPSSSSEGEQKKGWWRRLREKLFG